MKEPVVNSLPAPGVRLCCRMLRSRRLNNAPDHETPKNDVSPVPCAEQLKSEAQDWIVRLTSGRATTTDANALNAWCQRSPAHAHAYAEAKALWHALKSAAQSSF